MQGSQESFSRTLTTTSCSSPKPGPTANTQFSFFLLSSFRLLSGCVHTAESNQIPHDKKRTTIKVLISHWCICFIWEGEDRGPRVAVSADGVLGFYAHQTHVIGATHRGVGARWQCYDQNRKDVRLQTIHIPLTTSSGVKRATMTKTHPSHDTAHDAPHGIPGIVNFAGRFIA